MTYKLKYFASIREKANCASEQVEGEYENVQNLYNHLDKKYSFNFKQENLRVSINGEYKCFKTKIHDKDIIAFIPPVAGG